MNGIEKRIYLPKNQIRIETGKNCAKLDKYSNSTKQFPSLRCYSEFIKFEKFFKIIIRINSIGIFLKSDDVIENIVYNVFKLTSLRK